MGEVMEQRATLRCAKCRRTRVVRESDPPQPGYYCTCGSMAPMALVSVASWEADLCGGCESVLHIGADDRLWCPKCWAKEQAC